MLLLLSVVLLDQASDHLFQLAFASSCPPSSSYAPDARAAHGTATATVGTGVTVGAGVAVAVVTVVVVVVVATRLGYPAGRRVSRVLGCRRRLLLLLLLLSVKLLLPPLLSKLVELEG